MVMIRLGLKGANMSRILLAFLLVSFVSVTTGCSLKTPQYSPELGGFLALGKEAQKKSSRVARGGEEKEISMEKI